MNETTLARYSCEGCRTRKVKCDRKKPSCTNCTKASHVCFYPPAKKRISRSNIPRGAKRNLGHTRVSIGHDISLVEECPESLHLSETLEIPSPAEVVGSDWDLMETPAQPNARGLESRARKQYRDDRNIPPGYCTNFAHMGGHWVNSLVGDDSFSEAILAFTLAERSRYRSPPLPGTPLHPLPEPQTVVDCVKGYLERFNRENLLFQESEILNILDLFTNHAELLGVKKSAAINIILAYISLSSCFARNNVNGDHFFQNSLASIPSLMISEPDLISIGTLLCIAQYFIYSSELKPAVALLASTIQMMLLAGFQDIKKTQGLEAPDALHKRRLLWHAHIMDADLALRLRKSPILLKNFAHDLPEVLPQDGHGLLEFRDGSTVNFMRERVALANIQKRTYSLLYSTPSKQSSMDEIHNDVQDLDRELKAWKASVPAIIRPQRPLEDSDMTRLNCLTVLHFTYFQLVIAVHSAIFPRFSIHDPPEQKDRVSRSVALCVGAAQASISLLDFDNCTHPFTVSLLRQVSWSIDILFVNILQNRKSSRAHRDLALLEKLLRCFEKYDPDHANSAPYNICTVMHKIALRAVHNALYEVQLPSDAVIRRKGEDRSSIAAQNIDPNPPRQHNEVQNIDYPPVQLFQGYLQPLLSEAWEMDFSMGSEWTAPAGLQADLWQGLPTSWTDDMNQFLEFPSFE